MGHCTSGVLVQGLMTLGVELHKPILAGRVQVESESEHVVPPGYEVLAQVELLPLGVEVAEQTVKQEVQMGLVGGVPFGLGCGADLDE